MANLEFLFGDGVTGLVGRSSNRHQSVYIPSLRRARDGYVHSLLHKPSADPCLYLANMEYEKLREEEEEKKKPGRCSRVAGRVSIEDVVHPCFCIKK